MKLSADEIKVLVNTINPSVEYYYQQSNQPHATQEDAERYETLRTLQAKLEDAYMMSIIIKQA
jgi:hypothetical protein